MAEPDPYTVLGVPPSATAEAITSAFRRRARELRPDTRVDAVTAARFAEVRTAYETLRDPVRRAAHDQEYERSHRASSRPSGGAGTSRPFPRCPVVPGVTAPGPPLRAGPVRWVPERRTG